ncbi:hypothetical protein [Deinococcus sp.]|uniref:hypothetical protein n=1 Tax=Deinococcus sp. TaxID=47478 RepID=UPI003C7EB47A
MLVSLAVLLGPLLSAATPSAFPWTRGYLDVGRSLDQPLLFMEDAEQPNPPAQGWSRAPLPVMVSSVWRAGAAGIRKAELLPGVPESLGQSWRVPVGLRLSGSDRPAVFKLTGAGRGTVTVAVHPGLKVLATVRPGQEFLRLDLNAVYRHSGKVLDAPALAGRVLKLLRLESDRAVFRAEGLGEVERMGNPAQGFPDLAPLIVDPDLTALKRQYQGHTVWGYGGLHANCFLDQNSSIGKGVGLETGVTVRRVIRLGKPLLLNVQGGYGHDLGDEGDVLALTPLVFLLDAKPFDSTGDLGFSSISTADQAAPLLGAADAPPPGPEETDIQRLMELSNRPDICGLSVPYALIDTWAVTRVFSLTPPSRELLKLRQNLPKDALGLTRWQYAWLSGFPTIDTGTVGELLKLGVWQYKNIPSPATVSFDSAGNVSHVEIPNLP